MPLQLIDEKSFGGATNGESSPFGEISPRRNRIQQEKNESAWGRIIMTS
jgi:hypothetical protein